MLFFPSREYDNILQIHADALLNKSYTNVQAQFREFFENPDKLSLEKSNRLKLCGIKNDEK